MHYFTALSGRLRNCIKKTGLESRNSFFCFSDGLLKSGGSEVGPRRDDSGGGSDGAGGGDDSGGCDSSSGGGGGGGGDSGGGGGDSGGGGELTLNS